MTHLRINLKTISVNFGAGVDDDAFDDNNGENDKSDNLLMQCNFIVYLYAVYLYAVCSQ